MRRINNSGKFLPGVLLVALLCIAPAAAQLRLPRESQKASVMQTIGVADMTIVYSRPNAKGRTIWGAKAADPKAKDQPLVPYGEVWRSGADEATTFTITEDVTINGQPLPAGAYSLHTIPGPQEWVVIFNKVAQQWGSFTYDAKQDALRVTVKPAAAPMQEALAYEVSDTGKSSARVALHWEKVAVPFTVALPDVNALVLAKTRATLAQAKADDWRTPMQAANYYFQNNMNKEEAWAWLEKSIAIKETYQNLGLKARSYAAMGRKAEAIATGEKAIQVGKAADAKLDASALEKLLAEWRATK